MTRTGSILVAALLAAGAPVSVHAQISTKAQQAEQDALDAKTPKLNYKEEVLQLLVPGYTMGETVGVDVNSQNHVFVYSRTNPQGIARGGTAAMLWEFDQDGRFVKEWGPHNYAASFAHSVRVDRHDNVWQVDEGSGMIVKYSPQAAPLEQFGRTPEAIDYLESMVEKQGRGFEAEERRLEHPVDVQHRLHPDGGVGTFNRPTDVAWDSHENVFVSDGYGNSRLVKIAPGGHWLKWVGTWGTGPNQFNIIHSVAVDANDNVYAADRNNHRIQVYDDNLNFVKSITGMGAPWGLCVPRPDAAGKQYIFSSDGTSGRLYKIDIASGKVVGWAQTSLGRGEDDAGRLVHEIGCKDPNVVYVGSAILWNVTKVTIASAPVSSSGAAAQAPTPTYTSIPLEITVNKPAADVWKRIGKFCDIGEWLQIPAGCTIKSGKDGEFGAVRSVADEVLVGKTELSYTYTQTPRPDRPYNLYHGTLEARPVTATTSKLVYTIFFDNSMLPDDKAREEDKARRTATFTRALQNMKTLAEGGTLPPPPTRGGGLIPSP